MKGYKKYIGGNIIANKKLHYAQDWECFNTEDAEYEEGDLILSDTKRAIPYATYLAKGDIIVICSGGSILSSTIDKDISCNIESVYKPHEAAFEYFKEGIEIIKKQVADSENIPKNLEQTLYRGLFTDVFSVFELFLSDVILCLIYNCDDKYYEKAIKFFKQEKDIGESEPVKNLEAKVHRYFYDGIVYHRFEKVKSIFNEIFDIDVPDYKDKIKKFLHKRNNIVHRYSYSNQDRTLLTTLTRQDITDWIQVVEEFVGKLVEEIEKKIVLLPPISSTLIHTDPI